MKQIDYDQIKQELFFEKYKYVSLEEFKINLDKILKRLIFDLNLNEIDRNKENYLTIKNRIFKMINSYKNEIEELGVETKNSVLEEMIILNKTFLKTEQKIFNVKLNFDNYDSLFNKDNYEFLDYNFNTIFQINSQNLLKKLKDDLNYALLNDNDFNKFNTKKFEDYSNLTYKQLNTGVRTFYKKIREDTRARVEEIEFDSFIGWRSLGVLDKSTSPICIYLNNQFYSKNDYKNRSEIDNLPPRHFNCRSILIRVFKDKFEVATRVAKGDIGGYQVDNRITFESFLRQNEKTSKKILGTKRYDLWKTGKVKITDFIDIDNNKFFSADDIKEEFDL